MAKKKTKEAAFTDDDDALLAELGVEAEIKQDQTYTAKQERIIAGFEDIQRFYREHERLPQHGEGRDIFERLYAIRLDRIRGNAECLDLLRPMDAEGILTDRVSEPSGEYELDSDDELLEALSSMIFQSTASCMNCLANWIRLWIVVVAIPLALSFS